MGKHIHAFWHIIETNYSKLEKIWKTFGDFQYAWEKSSQAELKRAGVGELYAQRVLDLRGKLDLGMAMDKLWRADVFLIDQQSGEYPEVLLHIAKPPLLIYRKGAALDSLTNRVAIVGMRKASVQGEKLAHGLARNLAHNQVTVVSGLAFGIDAAAHTGTLAAEGKTIGVLASGISMITPTSHYNLAQKILQKGGAIISEYPVTSPAFKHQFVERNRLISGLSHTVVVIEAAKKSGSLITADHALEQGRQILAFPGDPGRIQSGGCNQLIKKGEAHLVDSISDVLQDLQDRKLIGKPNSIQQSMPIELDINDGNILTSLETEPKGTNELKEHCMLAWEDLMKSLSKLEMCGLIIKNSQLKWQMSNTA